MKRTFALIGFSEALTLLILNLTEIKYIPVIGAALAIIFITTLILPKYRQEMVFPVCLGSALFACILFMSVYYAAYAPSQVLNGKEAIASFYITSLPQKSESGYVYIAKAKTVMFSGAPQNIKIKIKSDYPIYADAYRLITAKLKFYSVGNTSFSSYGNWGKGIYLTAHIKQYKAGDTCANPLMLTLVNLRKDIINVLYERIGGDAGALAAALLTGDRSNLSEETNFAFKAAGASHLMAVSGLHLTVLSGALTGILNLLRVKKKPAAVIIVVFVILFSALTGFSRSVVRAGIMMCVLLSGYLFNRRADTLNSLGLAVFIICMNPFAVSDAGAVLSVLAVLSLCTGAKAVKEFNGSAVFKRKNSVLKSVAVYLLDGLTVSGCVVFFTLPAMYIFFGYYSLIGVIINVFIVPVGSLSTVLSLVTYLSDKAGILSELFNSLERGLNDFIISLVKLSAESSFSVIKTETYFGVVIAVILAVFALCFFIGSKRLMRAAAVFSVFLIIVTSFVSLSLDNSAGQLLICEDGAVAVVDGDKSAVYALNTKNDYYAVSSFLSSRDRNIDAIIVSKDDTYSLMLAEKYGAAKLISPEYDGQVLSDTNISEYISESSYKSGEGGIKYSIDYSYKTPHFSCSVNGFDINNYKNGGRYNIILARKTVSDYNGTVELDEGEIVYNLYKNKTFNVRRLNVWQG